MKRLSPLITAAVLFAAGGVSAQDSTKTTAPDGLFGLIGGAGGGPANAASAITQDYAEKAWRDAGLPEAQLPALRDAVDQAVGAALQDGRDAREALEKGVSDALDILAGLAGSGVENALRKAGIPDKEIAAAKKLVEDNVRALLAPGADLGEILDKSLADLAKIAADLAGDAVAETLKKAGLSAGDAKAAQAIVTDTLNAVFDPNTDTGKAFQEAGTKVVDLAKKMAGDAIERNLKMAGISDEQIKNARKIFDDTFDALRNGDTLGDAVNASMDDIINLASGLAGDAVQNALEKAGFSKKDAEAGKKLVEELVGAALSGDADLGDVLRDNLAGYALDKIEDLLGKEGREAFENAWNAIKDGADVWSTLGEAALDAIEVIAFDALEKIIGDQLAALCEKYPVIGEILGALGIDTASIMEGLHNIWGVITDLGSLQEKIQQLLTMAAEALMEMAQKLIDWAVGKITAALNQMISKIGQAVRDWVIGLLGKLTPALDALYAKFCQACQSLESALVQRVTGTVEELGEKVKDLLNAKPAQQALERARE
ncbi:MAG: hypothetical protein FWF96_01070 [Kiritimatiellaeota bacterium]|nr:hypothetical protein [Kiritimatiellota bacterium]